MSVAEPAKDRGTILAEERTDLAYQRTIIAAERTLMAWIRTALSMIGFGFTIYKFFQYQADEIASGKIQRPNAPRNLGLTFIAVGTLALAGAAWQHRQFLKFSAKIFDQLDTVRARKAKIDNHQVRFCLADDRHALSRITGLSANGQMLI